MKYLFILLIGFLNLFAFDSFITPCSLHDSFKEKNLIILDADSKALYDKSHISGSIHVEISKFIKSLDSKMIMASPQEVQKQFETLGINKDSNVVIYSHNTKSGLGNSTYLALIFISHGFKSVSILDGGYMAWTFEFPLLCETKKSIAINNGNFIINKDPNILVDNTYVKNSIGKIKILDSRDSKYYYGTDRSNNISSLGHIPSSQNSYYMDKFLTDGTIRYDDDLNEIFIAGHELKVDEEVIIYGDSIIDASINWYILYHTMGFKNSKIYEGSLIEWGNEDLPMVKFKWE